MSEVAYPVQWAGRQAVVTLPEHIDVSNAGDVSDELLLLINRGAADLIADMTATLSCDHAGADAVARAYQRAAASGTQLRLVVPAQVVRRVLSINGIDRVVPIYPSLDAATAAAVSTPVISPTADPAKAAARARRRWAAGAPEGPRSVGITPGVLWKLIDAFIDGVALVDENGVLALVNRRVEEMFGYRPGELVGQPVEVLVPTHLRAAHRGDRAAYDQAPAARPMGAGARLVGLRRDGATVPVQISLSPVPTATGHLTLAVIRDVTQIRPREDIAGLARAAAMPARAHPSPELLASITRSLFDVGVSLQDAIDLPHHVARQRIIEALQCLDDVIREIRDYEIADPPDVPGLSVGAEQDTPADR